MTDFNNPAGCGQAGNVVIDVGDAQLVGGGNRLLTGIEFENTGIVAVTVTSIVPTWSNGQLIEDTSFDANVVWSHVGPGTPSGRQPSGTALNIVDRTVNAGDEDILSYLFNGSMAGTSVTFTFNFSDGTQRYATLQL